MVTAPTVTECKKVDATHTEVASPTRQNPKRTTASTPVQPTPSSAKRARGASGAMAIIVTGTTPSRAVKVRHSSHIASVYRGPLPLAAPGGFRRLNARSAREGDLLRVEGFDWCRS